MRLLERRRRRETRCVSSKKEKDYPGALLCPASVSPMQGFSNFEDRSNRLLWWFFVFPECRPILLFLCHKIPAREKRHHVSPPPPPFFSLNRPPPPSRDIIQAGKIETHAAKKGRTARSHTHDNFANITEKKNIVQIRNPFKASFLIWSCYFIAGGGGAGNGLKRPLQP